MSDEGLGERRVLPQSAAELHVVRRGDDGADMVKIRQWAFDRVWDAMQADGSARFEGSVLTAMQEANTVVAWLLKDQA